MATRIVLQHKDTGVLKNGYYGFSWTTLFFWFIPALFRADFLTFLVGFVITVIFGFFTMGLSTPFISIVWAFMYNKYYTRRLLERGYMMVSGPGDNALAASKLGVAPPTTAVDVKAD